MLKSACICLPKGFRLICIKYSLKNEEERKRSSNFAELLLNARENFNSQVPCYCNLSPAQKFTNYMITVKLLFQFLSKKHLVCPVCFSPTREKTNPPSNLHSSV